VADIVGTVVGSSVRADADGVKTLSITIEAPCGANAVTLTPASAGTSAGLARGVPGAVSGLNGRVATITVAGGTVTVIAIT
jgi:hypothetical protein